MNKQNNQERPIIVPNKQRYLAEGANGQPEDGNFSNKWSKTEAQSQSLPKEPPKTIGKGKTN